MEPEADVVESLIRGAGRRTEPPADAYRQVYTVVHDAFRRKTGAAGDRNSRRLVDRWY